MKIATNELFTLLEECTQRNLQYAKKMQDLSIQKLNYKADENTWSILECIEHLNRYGNFYLPEINQQIKKAKHEPSKLFVSRFLGNYFVQSIKPKKKLNKMKTFTTMNPNGSVLTKEVLTKFIAQQNEILNLLVRARKVNLNKTKTAISISRWIKLKLGDTFQVLIYHNQRHIEQAKKIMAFLS